MVGQLRLVRLRFRFSQEKSYPVGAARHHEIASPGAGRTTPMEGFVADLVKTFESGKIDDPFGYDVQLSRLDEAAFTSGG
jgi:hypothetical protein